MFFTIVFLQLCIITAIVTSTIKKPVQSLNYQAKQLVTSQTVSLDDISFFIQTNIDKLNERTLSTLLHGISKKSLKLPAESCILVTLKLLNQQEVRKYKKITPIDKFTLTKLFQGLRCFDESAVDSRQRLLVFLSKTLEEFHTKKTSIGFGPVEISQSLYALQNCSIEYQPELQLILRMLVAQVKNCREIFGAQEISNCVYGMKSMSNCYSANSYVCDKHDVVEEALHVLSWKLTETTEELTGQGIAMILYGMQSMHSGGFGLQDMMVALSKKMQDNKQEMSSIELGIAFYGLQSMRIDDPGMEKVLHVLSKKLRKCKENMSSRSISMILYGLQGMRTGSSPALANVIAALTKKIILSSDAMYDQSIGMALFGCQSLSSQEKGVSSLIKALTAKIKKSQCCINEQTVAMALYGLQKMNSKDEAINDLIFVLAKKIASSQSMSSGLSSQAIGQAMYGLKEFDSNDPGVSVLLTTLADKISLSKEPLIPRAIANALYGMQNMGGRDVSPSVGYLLNTLVNRIDTDIKLNPTLQMNDQEIGNALYGLKRMKSTDPGVPQILHVLAVLVAQSSSELSGQAIGNSLYGLQHMDTDDDGVNALVRALTSKIKSSSSEMNGQEIGNALYGLRTMSSSSIAVRELLTAITQKIMASNQELNAQVSSILHKFPTHKRLSRYTYLSFICYRR